MLKELVRKNRSYRRFDESVPIRREDLEALVDLARLSASGMNMQPLKYYLSHTREMNEKIFPCLAWAAYIADWEGPGKGERPAGYIIILGDRSIRKTFGVDYGIAAQTILLGAVEKGFGGCMIASVNRRRLRKELQLSEQFEILLVIALGKPVETVVIDELGKDGDIRYYRDQSGVHHVPKRSLREIIIN